MKSIFAYLLFSILSINSVYTTLFSDQLNQMIVNLINDARRRVSPQSSNMREIGLSECLAGLASGYLESCPEGDAKNPNLQEQAEAAGCVPPGVTVGRSIQRPLEGGENSFDIWALQNYDYETNSCGEGTCDNYLQLMNAESYLSGCAFTVDSDCENEDPTFLCYFANASKEGERPYIEGEPCNQCVTTDCNDRLCSGAIITEATTTSQVTTPQVTSPNDHHHHGHGHHHSHDHKNDKDDTSKTPESADNSHTPKPHDHGDGHKSHDHNHGKKHDHAHNHGDGDMNGQMSVGHFAGSSSSSASINKIAILLLIASLFATLQI